MGIEILISRKLKKKWFEIVWGCKNMICQPWQSSSLNKLKLNLPHVNKSRKYTYSFLLQPSKLIIMDGYRDREPKVSWCFLEKAKCNLNTGWGYVVNIHTAESTLLTLITVLGCMKLTRLMRTISETHAFAFPKFFHILQFLHTLFSKPKIILFHYWCCSVISILSIAYFWSCLQFP